MPSLLETRYPYSPVASFSSLETEDSESEYTSLEKYYFNDCFDVVERSFVSNELKFSSLILLNPKLSPPLTSDSSVAS